MGRSKAIVEDLLANLSGVVTIQSSSSQSQPKAKPKDTVPISKLVEARKSTSSADKRPVEAEGSNPP